MIWPFKKKTAERTIAQSTFWNEVAARWGGADGGLTTEKEFYREGYKKCATVYACIERRRDAIRSLDWYAYRVNGKDRKELSIDHPLMKLIRRTNMKQGLKSLLADVTGYMDATGNSFVHVVAGDAENRGTPRELWTVKPEKVKIIPGYARGLVERYELRDKDGNITIMQPWELAHFARWDPEDDDRGLSPMQAAGLAIQQNNASQESNRSIVQNNFSVPAWVENPENMTPEQFDDLSKQLKEWTGKHKTDRVPILEGGLKLHQWGVTLAEMQWIEGLNITETEIMKVYGVPPALIQENPTHANAEDSRPMFFEITVLPLADQIAEAFNTQIAPRFGDGIEIDYDKDAIEALQEDRTQLRDFALRAFNDAAFTRNQFLTIIGEDERPDGDVYKDGLMTIYTPAKGIGSRKAQIADKATLDRAEDVGGMRMFTLSDAADQRAYLQQIERIRRPLEDRMTGVVNSRFRDEAKDVVAAIEMSDTPEAAKAAAESTINDQYAAWEDTYRRVYGTVGDTFARRAYDGIGKSGAGPEERKDVADRWQARVAMYLQTVGARKIVGVRDTTKDRIARQIEVGIAEGEGIDQIGKRVQGEYKAFTEARSRVIARTETIAASNAGSNEGARATGLALMKYWIAGQDERVRDGEFDHSNVESPIPMDEQFNVSGELLDFPGDTSYGASAGNVINCRCAVGYEPVYED